MKIIKSFGISLAVYIGINLIFISILQALIYFNQVPLQHIYSIWPAPVYPFKTYGQYIINLHSFFLDYNIFLLSLPPGYAIFSILYNLWIISIWWKIFFISAIILPSLISSIIAGRKSESKRQAFISWMLVMIVSGIIITVFYLFNFTAMYHFIYSFFPYIGNNILITVWIFIGEILTGLFFSVLAILFVKKNPLKQK